MSAIHSTYKQHKAKNEQNNKTKQITIAPEINTKNQHRLQTTNKHNLEELMWNQVSGPSVLP